MSDAKGKTVSVTALKAHTNAGHSYEAGDTYDVLETEVGNLAAQGMAQPSDQVAQDAKDAKAADKAAKAAEHDAHKSKK